MAKHVVTVLSFVLGAQLALLPVARAQTAETPPADAAAPATAAPVDPNAAPADPNAVPVDPNAVPVDPNAAPVDPNAAPADPNAVPVEPATQPAEAAPVEDMPAEAPPVEAAPVEAAPEEAAPAEAAPEPAPAAAPKSDRGWGWLSVAGWASLAVGTIGVVIGAVTLANPQDFYAATANRRITANSVFGFGALIAGAALAVVGGVLLYLDTALN